MSSGDNGNGFYGGNGFYNGGVSSSPNSRMMYGSSPPSSTGMMVGMSGGMGGGMLSSSPEYSKNFVVDGSEKHVQDILSKLKFISKIKVGDIVDTKSLSLMDSGWITSLYRTFIARGDGREATFQLFQCVLTNALDIGERYAVSPDQMFRDVGATLVDTIKESMHGMGNHAQTYEKDVMYVSRVETLIKTTNIRLDDMLRKIQTQNYLNGNYRSHLI